MNQKGFISILIIFLNLFILFLIIFFSTIFILRQTTSIAIANVKQDLYSINRSAITLLNKKVEKYDMFAINEESYEQCLKEMLIKNYNLDTDLKNGKGYIKEIEILECSYRYGKDEEPDLHTKVKIGLKIPIYSQILNNCFYFNITENTKVKKVKA